jgi:hypothetical protein
MREIFIINTFPEMILARFGVLLVFSIAFIWVYSFIRLRITNNEKFSLKINIINCFIESLLLLIILFALYFSLFITVNDWQSYVWDEWRWAFVKNIYFLLLPEITLFSLLNIFFFIRIYSLSKIKKL